MEDLDLIFSFSRGILEILDPVRTLPWDPRDLGSLREIILLDPGDPGPSLRKLSCDLQILDLTQQCQCILNILYPTKCCFWFPIPIR